MIGLDTSAIENLTDGVLSEPKDPVLRAIEQGHYPRWVGGHPGRCRECDEPWGRVNVGCTLVREARKERKRDRSYR